MSSRDTCVTLLQPASLSQIWCLQLAVVQNPILEYFIYILFLNIVIIAIIIISIVIIVFSDTIIFFPSFETRHTYEHQKTKSNYP